MSQSMPPRDFDPTAVPPMNPYDSPETVRPGMSGGAKVLLGIGIGCGVLVLLCCGGGGISLFMLGRSMQHSMSDDPATIRGVAAGIVSIDVPEVLKPQMSFDWTVPWFGYEVAMAIFADEGDHSALVLFQLVGERIDPNQVRLHFSQALEQSGREREHVRLVESEPFDTEINGSPASFTVGHGVSEETGGKVWQASGAFEGRGGPAMLFMQVDATEFDKEQMLEVLKSMK